MSVAARARERGISEILHYTPQMGVQGCVMKGSVLSRKRMENDETLAYISEGVWPRRDDAWIDHVSLSVSRINASLYDKSRARHPNWWWAVLSFSPDILDHEDVWFTTTNNVYEDVLQRGQGLEGFEALFKERVPWGYYGSVCVRREDHPDHWTTDRQAEVLYLGELSLEYLQRIYVPGSQHSALVHAWCDVFGRPEYAVVVDPAVFS